jgi:hypothetical protein
MLLARRFDIARDLADRNVRAVAEGRVAPPRSTIGSRDPA